MKIMPIMQSNSNQNKTNFKGTCQVLIKMGDTDSARVSGIFYSTLNLRAPTAIQEARNSESGVYKIKASFSHKRDFIIPDILAELAKKYTKMPGDISFYHTSNQHSLTLKELKNFKLPSITFDKGVLESEIPKGGISKAEVEKGLVSGCISALNNWLVGAKRKLLLFATK